MSSTAGTHKHKRAIEKKVMDLLEAVVSYLAFLSKV